MSDTQAGYMTAARLLRHLLIDEFELGEGEEWMDRAPAWQFLKVRKGAVYWLSKAETRPLCEGETIILSPAANGAIRASQLNEVSASGFKFNPEMLSGFLTLAEREFFKNPSDKARTACEILPSNHPFSKQFALLSLDAAKPPQLCRRVEAFQLAASFFGEKLLRQAPATKWNTTAVERFQNLIIQMPESEMMHHTIEQLAHLCACSPRHFNRLFRASFSTSAR